jgi:hypothetical protein
MEQIGPTWKNEKAERTEKSTLNPKIYLRVAASDRNPRGTYSLQFLTVFLASISIVTFSNVLIIQ